MPAACRIRRASVADLPRITQIYNEAIDDDIANCELGGFAAEERLEWFRSHDDRFPLWVAEAADGVVGWTCLSPYERKPCFDRSATFSTYVARSHRGGGVGSVLREHLIAQARELGFHAIVNRVFARNDASVRLATKYGFEKVGYMKEMVYKKGEYWDCVFFQLILSEAALPVAPVPRAR